MIFLLLATLALGPEKPVTESPRLVSTRVAPQVPRVVTDGNDFLVAWNGGASFAHVNSAGDVLDRPSLNLATPPNVRYFDLIRHGNANVVGWYYFTDAGVVHIRAGALDLELPNADINSDSFRLISNGTTLGAMYRLKSGETALTFFDSGRTIALPGSGAVASDGVNFFVLQGTSAVLITGSGDRLANVALPFTARDVIFDGSEYVIVGSTGGAIEIARLSRSGQLTTSAVVDNARGTITGLTVSATAADLLIAWKEAYPGPYPSSPYSVSLQARSVSRNGVVLVKSIDDPMEEFVGRFAGWTDPPAIASNGPAYLLVWTEGSSLENLPMRSLFSLLVHPMESLSNDEIDRRKKSVPTTFALQDAPASARNGDHLLLAWSETFGDVPQQQIVATRLTPEGETLDGAGVIVAPNASQQQNPSAAWDGKRTWIAWNRGTGGIDAAYVLADGSRGMPISISSAGGAPKIACADDACLVLWAENRSHDTNQRELFAARIVHGELLDLNGFLIGTGQSYVGVGDYAVATDGSRFLVAWADRIFSGGAIVHSVSFGPLASGVATRNGDLAATTASYASPRIAWNGREYDVLWRESASIRASRVSAEGSSMDGDATGWAGVRVSDGSLGIPTDLVAVGDTLYLGSTSALTRLDPTTFAILGAAELASAPVIAALDADHVFVAYPVKSRLFLRRVNAGRRRAVATNSLSSLR
jgi:hypothetical protein